MLIIINGHGIYTAPCDMCLRQANPLRAAFEGLGPKSQDFWGPTLKMPLVIDLPQTHYVQGRINTTSIGGFMYMGPK